MTTAELVDRFQKVIIDPLLLLLFALGLLWFLWGVVIFIWNANSEEARKTGVRHMTWGIVGMFIMVAAWGIINLISNTFGL